MRPPESLTLALSPKGRGDRNHPPGPPSGGGATAKARGGDLGRL